MIRDPLYEIFGDFLHEVPEAEQALRDWLDRKWELERREQLHERSRQAALKHLRSSTREERVAEANRFAELSRMAQARRDGADEV